MKKIKLKQKAKRTATYKGSKFAAAVMRTAKLANKRKQVAASKRTTSGNVERFPLPWTFNGNAIVDREGGVVLDRASFTRGSPAGREAVLRHIVKCCNLFEGSGK